MTSLFIVAQSPVVPRPDEIVAALKTADHAATLVETRAWMMTALTIELAVGPSGTRIIIDVSEDLGSESDIDASSREMVEELVPEDERAAIRRLITVRHWDHVDRAIVEALVEHLCSVTSGAVASTTDLAPGY
jgi:hypothetical protein